MNPLRCIIVDDEPLARQGLLEYVKHADFLKVVGVFDNAQEVYSVMNELEIDLVFLDIEMPRITGIDFIRSLKEPPMVIITTAYHQYALEGFELDVVDYLLKPISLSRFLKAANKARDLQSSKKPGNLIADVDDFFFVKENGRYTRIFYREVLFAEALQNYVSIHLQDRKVISYITMAILEKQFPSQLFMRVHKSYIVALGKIDAIEGNIVTINKTAIPVSRASKDELIQRALDKKLLRR